MCESHHVQDQERGSGGSNWKNRRLDFPTYYGEDPDGGLMKAEKYFSFYHLSDREKLEAAVICFEG